MKKILFFLGLTILLGCNTGDDIKCLSMYYDTSATFRVFNEQNEDLLDLNSPHPLDVSKIKVFYLVNNVKKEYNNGGVDYPKGCLIYRPEYLVKSRIAIYLNTEEKANKTTTYVQWNEKDTDTIESTFQVTDCSKMTYQVWYNGKLFYDKDVDDGTYPTIIK